MLLSDYIVFRIADHEAFIIHGCLSKVSIYAPTIILDPARAETVRLTVSISVIIVYKNKYKFYIIVKFEYNFMNAFINFILANCIRTNRFISSEFKKNHYILSNVHKPTFHVQTTYQYTRHQTVCYILGDDYRMPWVILPLASIFC